jgi:hypothetical protein
MRPMVWIDTPRLSRCADLTGSAGSFACCARRAGYVRQRLDRRRARCAGRSLAHDDRGGVCADYLSMGAGTDSYVGGPQIIT